MTRGPIQYAQQRNGTRSDTWLPSPDEIRRRAAAIRSTWSPEERRQRAVNIPGLPLLPLLLGGGRVPALATACDRTRRGR